LRDYLPVSVTIMDAVEQGKAIAGWEGATSSEVVACRFYRCPFWTGTFAVYYFSAQTQTTTTKSVGAGQEYIYWYEWGLPYEFWDDGPEWGQSALPEWVQSTLPE
jgi:hypothetical protein